VTRPGAPTPRRRRTRLRLALALLGLCALLVACGLFPQEPLRRLVETRLRAALGPNTRVQRLHVVPALLRVDLQGVAFSTASATAEVERARLELAWGLLWGRPLALRRLELHAPRLQLTPAPAAAGGTPWRGPLVVQSLHVTDGRLEWQADDDTRLYLEGLTATGALGSGQVEWRAPTGHIERVQAGRRLALGALHVQLASSPTLELRLLSAQARLGDSQLAAQGLLGAPGAWRPELALTGTLELADLGFAVATPALVGRASLSGQVRPESDGLRAELKLASATLSAESWPLEHVDVQLVHHTAGAGESQATLRAQALGGGLRGMAQRRGARLDATLDLVGIDAALLARRVGPRGAFPGRLSAQARLQGPLGRALQLDAQAQGQLSLGGQPLQVTARVRGPLQLEQRRTALTWTFDVNAPGQAQQAFAGATLRAEGRAEGSFPPPLTGTLAGQVTLRGPRGPFVVPFQGAGRVVQGRSALALDAALLEGRAHADLATGGAHIDVLHVTATGVELAALHPDAGGTVAFEASLTGPVDALSGSVDARARATTWQGAPLGPVDARLTLATNGHTLHASAPSLGAELNGRPSASAFDGTLHLRKTPLADLTRLTGRPLVGTLSALASVRVPWRAPRAAEVQARVDALEVGQAQTRMQSLQPFDVTYSAGRVQVAGLLAEGFGTRLEGHGSYGGPGQVLNGSARLEAELARWPLPQAPTLAGRVVAELSLAGTLQRPRATGYVEARDVSARAAWLPDLDLPRARIEVAGDRLHLPDTRVQVAGGSVSLRGALPWASFWPTARARRDALAGDERGQLDVELHALDLATLLARWRPEQAAPVAGSVSAKLALSGGSHALDELSGRLELPTTALRVGELDVQVLPAELALRAGRVSSEALELRAADASLRIDGGVDLVGRTWDLRGQGGLDLRVLAALGTLGVTGRSRMDLALAGPWSTPRATGTLQVEDGTLRLRTLAQPLTEIGGLLRVQADELRFEGFRGRLGGGALEAEGQARLTRAGLRDVALALRARDVGLRYPVGLRSRLDADLRLAGDAGALLLTGQVRAPRAFYDLDAVAEHSLFARAQPVRPTPLLRAVALDLDVLLAAPARARSRNALANFDVTGALRLRGDLETPAPFGRLDVAAGGSARVQGHEFVLAEDGVLAYEGTWNARLGLSARSRDNVRDRSASSAAARYRVILEAAGTLEAPELHFRTEPRAFFDGQVLNLLATGDPGAGEAYRSGGRLVGEQALLVLGGGRLTRGLAAGLETLGVDEVSVEPRLLARDTRPGARFTFGKRLGDHGRLVYSTSLNDAAQRFVKLELGPWHALTLTGQRDESGVLRAGAGQTLEWGGVRAPKVATPRDERLRLSAVRIEGDQPLPAARLHAWLGLKVGDRRTSLALLDDAERLRAGLLGAGYIEAEVGVHLDGSSARFTVKAGPRFETRVSGLARPPDLRTLLQRALFEDEALEAGRARLLHVLHARGHLRAEVRTRVEAGPALRTLVFEVEPGARLRVESLRFVGARRLGPGALLRAAGGLGALVADPAAAAEAWRAAYRDVHHLAARITGPNVVQRGDALLIEAQIDEGTPARLAGVRFEGATRDVDELRHAVALPTDAPFEASALPAATTRLREHYLGLGYAGVGVVARLEPRDADYELVFELREGTPATLESVEYVGAQHTATALLASRARLTPGQPLDLRRLAQAEQHLVDLTTITSARALPGDERPGQVRVTLSEAAPYAFSYELTWEDATGFVGQVDGERRHLFRHAGVLGGRYRLGREDSEARAYFGMPFASGSFTLSASRRAEDVESVLGAFTRLQRELEFLQDLPAGRHWRLQGRYRFKRITLPPLLPAPIDTAVFGVSALRDTRNNRLDPRHGRFYSLSVELAQGAFGSNLEYVKGFAQASLARTRGSVTWAQGYRLGLGSGLGGQPLAPSSERYRAGGGDTLRGYARDGLGPRDILGEAAGGEAVLVLNQELRYRHPSGMGGVLFWDAGNVYEKLGELRGLRLRHAWGLGLRYTSAVGLLRLDLGVPVARRSGERAYQIYFSLGQAF
jgi:outer membrane protein assembly factor BamA